MAGIPIDAAERRLLSNIIALALDEQPGQAAAALEALRRRAAQDRITGGALKNLFERIAADETAGGVRAARNDIHRLQQDLESVRVQASRLAAENASLHRRVAQAEGDLQRHMVQAIQQRPRSGSGPLHYTPPHRARHTAGLLAGMLMTLLGLGLARDTGGVPWWWHRPAAPRAVAASAAPVQPQHQPARLDRPAPAAP